MNVIYTVYEILGQFAQYRHFQELFKTKNHYRTVGKYIVYNRGYAYVDVNFAIR